MFALCSNITIGNYKGIKPNDVKITKSIFEYVDRAKIKLPITARIKRAGEVITASAETAKQFKEGDFVQIALGYNGKIKQEFEGFVNRVNFTQPVEIECEGYSYKLRKNTYLKTFVNAQLKEVLQFLIAGTGIVLDKSIPGFKIDKLVLDKNSGTEALEKIKKISDNTIRFFFTGKTLYAGLLFEARKETVQYELGWNVIKDNSLKLREAKNTNVVVNYIGEKKDGTKVKVNKGKTNASAIAGVSGETKLIRTHAVTDEKSLQLMATAKHEQLSFDGYEGKITAFGAPYCEHGYSCSLFDKKYPERAGKYIVESVEVNYGMSGFRRIVGIGKKVK